MNFTLNVRIMNNRTPGILYSPAILIQSMPKPLEPSLFSKKLELNSGIPVKAVILVYMSCPGHAKPIDDYAKNGGPGEVWLLCSFYHESFRTWIKTTVNKFAISNHTVLTLGLHALRSYLKLIVNMSFHSLPNK